MIINKETSFIKTYFDDTDGDKLKSTITPNWDEDTLNRHLKMINIPKNVDVLLRYSSIRGRGQ